MTAYKIEKGVILPNLSVGGKYPYSSMEIGDSFFVPSSDASTPTVRQRAYQYGREAGMKFRTRSEKNGLRVWRIE